MFKPKSVNILSKVYPISYLRDVKNVNTDKDSLRQGEISFASNVGIRIFDNGQVNEANVLSVLFEEVIHGIETDMSLTCFEGKRHKELGPLCNGLADVFLRNGWWRTK